MGHLRCCFSISCYLYLPTFNKFRREFGKVLFTMWFRAIMKCWPKDLPLLNWIISKTFLRTLGGCAPPHWGGGLFFKIWWRGGGLESIHGGLKMLLKNTCEGVHLLVKLQPITLQACKFTKNKLIHTYFPRILARF